MGIHGVSGSCSGSNPNLIKSSSDTDRSAEYDPPDPPALRSVSSVYALGATPASSMRRAIASAFCAKDPDAHAALNRQLNVSAPTSPLRATWDSNRRDASPKSRSCAHANSAQLSVTRVAATPRDSISSASASAATGPVFTPRFLPAVLLSVLVPLASLCQWNGSCASMCIACVYMYTSGTTREGGDRRNAIISSNSRSDPSARIVAVAHLDVYATPLSRMSSRKDVNAALARASSGAAPDPYPDPDPDVDPPSSPSLARSPSAKPSAPPPAKTSRTDAKPSAAARAAALAASPTPPTRVPPVALTSAPASAAWLIAAFPPIPGVSAPPHSSQSSQSSTSLYAVATCRDRLAHALNRCRNVMSSGGTPIARICPRIFTADSRSHATAHA